MSDTSTTDEKPAESAEGQTPESAAPEGQAAETTPEEKAAADKLSHDDALSALESTRKEAANYRTRAREAEEKLAKAKTPDEVTEIVNDMKRDRENAERSLLVENVALRHNLPDDLAALLKGDTREALDAHAATLAKYVPKSEEQEEQGTPRGGLTPDSEDDGFDPVKLVAQHGRTYY